MRIPTKTQKWQHSPPVVSRYKGASLRQAAIPGQGMDAQTDGRVAKTPRVEDDVLVRGNGRYAADVAVPGQVYACFVRSPHAFARIADIDAESASAAPGVLGVFTASDMAGSGTRGRPPPLVGRGGNPLILPHRPPLAGDRAMHI